MKHRWIEHRLEKYFKRPFVQIMFGARQTGKTTLLRHMLEPALHYNLADPVERSRILADPGVFIRECKALPEGSGAQTVFVDEAQAAPALFDAVQSLYDTDRDRFRFVLCGSCARKLRKAGTNLLPGRSMLHRLYALILHERPSKEKGAPGMILDLPSSGLDDVFPAADLEDRLAFGELPGIALMEDEEDRSLILQSYVEAHLQEEIRRETMIRDWGTFVNFLRLAAMESGKIINYADISRNAGISIPTVKSYYELLQDMFIGYNIPAFSGSSRKSVLSTPRFFFTDMGIRHAAASIPPGRGAAAADAGNIFKQWVGAELYKRLSYSGQGRLSYFRTKAGAEVDFIIERDGGTIPVEVKWTKNPAMKDTRHLRNFIREQAQAEKGFLVCRCPRPMQMTKEIKAVPWFMI